MRGVLTGLALAVLIAVAGCGRSPDESQPSDRPAADTIARAYDTTLAAGTGRVVETFRVEASAGVGVASITEAVFDLATGRTRLELRAEASSPRAAALVLGESGGQLDGVLIEIVRDGDVVYLTGPGSPAFDGGWLRFDAADFPLGGTGLELADGAPTKGLALVESAAAPASATATSAGDITYASSVPAVDALGLLAASFIADRILTGQIASPDDPVPVTVVVNQHEQIVEVTYELTSFARAMVDQTELDQTAAEQVTASYQVRVDRLGEPVTISVPTDDEIIDPSTFGG